MADYPTEAEVANWIRFQERRDEAMNGTVIRAEILLYAQQFIPDELLKSAADPNMVRDLTKAELIKWFTDHLVTEDLVYEVGRLHAIAQEARRCPRIENHLELIHG